MTSSYLKTGLRRLDGGDGSYDGLEELLAARKIIHADLGHGFNTTPYGIKAARAHIYDDYKDWFRNAFPECYKRGLSCISKCLAAGWQPSSSVLSKIQPPR